MQACSQDFFRGEGAKGEIFLQKSPLATGLIKCLLNNLIKNLSPPIETSLLVHCKRHSIKPIIYDQKFAKK